MEAAGTVILRIGSSLGPDVHCSNSTISSQTWCKRPRKAEIHENPGRLMSRLGTGNMFPHGLEEQFDKFRIFLTF